MIDHFGITVSNLEKSREFYLKTLRSLGYALIIDTPDTVSFGVRDGHRKSSDPAGEFWLSEGPPSSPPVHFAFNAASRPSVDAFFAEGKAVGGVDNGAPDLRLQYHPNYYAAYLLDPDGYNIEAVCHVV